MRRLLFAVAVSTVAAGSLHAQTFVTSIDISTQISASTGIHAAHIAVDNTGANPILYVNPLNNGAAGQTLNIVKIDDPLGTPAVSTFTTNDAGGAGVAATRGSGGIAVDGAGNVFVGWTGNGGDDSARVRRYNPAGSNTGEWLHNSGLSERPGGIDVNAAGTGFVVARFLSTATMTTHIEITGANTLNRTFVATPATHSAQNPRDIAFDATNDKLYINTNGILMVINGPAATPLFPAAAWGTGSSTVLQNPGANSFAGHGVAINADGSLIGYSPNQNAGVGARTFRIVNPAGDTVYTLGTLDTPGDGTGALLQRPVDAAFFSAGGNDYVAITDYQLNVFSRVVVFDITPPTPSTRTVDGVGVSPGTFATLAAAIADLIASPDNGDTAVDTIEITANTTETAHVGFDLQTQLLDEIVVNGNDNTIVMAPSTISGNVAMSIVNGNGSTITIRDLTILPQYDTAGGATSFGGGTGTGAAMRIWDNGVATSGASATLENVTISGSTVGDAAVDPNAAAPTDITRFVMPGSPIFAGGIRIDATTGGSANTIDIVDSVVAHTGNRGIYTQHKDGMTLNTTNTQASYNVLEGLRTFSMLGDWNITDCVSVFNASHGFGVAGTGAATANVNISGGEFSGNSGAAAYGIDLSAACTITIDGVQIIGNANRGLRYNSAALVAPSLTNSVIANNGSFGIDVNEINTDLSWTGGISNLILSGNGTISATPSNFSYGDTHTGAATITVSNVTFHNPGGDQGTTFIARNFDHRFGNDQTWQFVDCIFSGVAADDDVAFIVRGTTDRGIAISVSNSAIVDSGSNALDLEEIPSGGSPANINQTAVITSDPLYLSTTVGDATFLHVDSQCYATAASGSQPLAGGATYVGGTACASNVGEWMILND